MVNKVHLAGKVQLEYRTEQILLHAQLKGNWGPRLIRSDMEEVLNVAHPDYPTRPYETKVDCYYLLKGPNRNISICLDLHGTWHEKNKVQVRDTNKREALEYCGHHYIEIRNYAGAEECPALWDAAELAKRIPKIVKPGTIQIFQDNLDRKMREALREVSYQLTVQLAESRPNKPT